LIDGRGVGAAGIDRPACAVGWVGSVDAAGWLPARSTEPRHSSTTNNRKKRLLALFVALATIGLIIGLAVAFKPDGSNKAGQGVSD